MNDLYISIDSHHNPNPYFQQIFTVNFFCTPVRTTVTSSPSVVRNWLSRVLSFHRYHRHKLVVGLGVQWRPSYSTIPPSPATLQLCIGRQCLIFQLLHADYVPSSLRHFLNDTRNTFVGVWNSRDRDMLLSSKHRLWVHRIVDLRLGRRLSMEKLAEIYLGADDVRKPEWIGRSAWDAVWLSKEQVQYACVDAYVSFLLGKALKAWNL